MDESNKGLLDVLMHKAKDGQMSSLSKGKRRRIYAWSRRDWWKLTWSRVTVTENDFAKARATPVDFHTDIVLKGEE